MSYVVLLLAVGVTIYALIDCWNSADGEVRGLPRLAWLLIVLLFPLIGGVAYLIANQQRFGSVRPHRPRVTAPDDDPEFLLQLDQQRRRAAAEERRREQQLRRERKEREKVERKDTDRQSDHGGEGHSGRTTS